MFIIIIIIIIVTSQATKRIIAGPLINSITSAAAYCQQRLESYLPVPLVLLLCLELPQRTEEIKQGGDNTK